MQEFMGVHHVSVSVPDLARAREFYIDLLGAEEVSAVEWEAGNAFIDDIVGLKDSAGKQFIARLGNIYIEAFQYLSPPAPAQDPDRPVNRGGYTHFALQVSDIDAVYRRMVDAGIRFHAPPADGGEVDDRGRKLGMRATYGRDFFGNVFELIECNHNSPVAPL